MSRLAHSDIVSMLVIEAAQHGTNSNHKGD